MSRPPRDIPGLSVMIGLVGMVVAGGLAASHSWTASVDQDAEDVGAAWPDMRIDINAASAGELALLPGVGDGRAQMIVDDREANGAFVGVDDLHRVRGLGSITIERLRPFAVVGEVPAATD